MSTAIQDVTNSGDGEPSAVPEPSLGPRDASERLMASSESQMSYLVVAMAMLMAAFYVNILILLDVALTVLHESEYDRKILIRMWDALFVGQLIGQIILGFICDSIGPQITLCASTIVILTGAVLCTAARGVSGSTSGFLWFLTIARGIIGVGIGGVYPSASIIAIEATRDRTKRDFVLMTNGIFSAGSPLATALFLIILAAAQPEHLNTVWPVCIGIGLALPLVGVCYSGISMISRRFRGAVILRWHLYSAELKSHWTMMVCTCCLWFVYGFVAYPKVVFSGEILLAIVDGNLWRTAGFELLLGAFTLAGSIVGAILCQSFGRRGTMLVSFIGYDVFALIIGCAYNRLVKIVPLLVVFYALMLSMGNMGPGNLLSLVAVESYPQHVRGLFYGLTSAFGTAGAIVGIHAFNTIDENLRKEWGFIIAAICGVVGFFIAWFLPSDATSTGSSEKDSLKENTASASHSQGNACSIRGPVNTGGGITYPTGQNSIGLCDNDKDESSSTQDDFVATSMRSLRNSVGMPGSFDTPDQFGGRLAPASKGDSVNGLSASVVGNGPSASAGPLAGCLASTPSVPIHTTMDLSPCSMGRVVGEGRNQERDQRDGSYNPPESNRVLLLQRMRRIESGAARTPSPVESIPDVQEAHEVIAEHVATSQLQKFYTPDNAFVNTVASNVTQLRDNGESFPVTRQNRERLVRLSLYHLVIYCDDSGSMSWDEPRSRWALQRDAVHRIANITTRALPPQYGVSLRFINSQRAQKDNIPASAVLQAIDTVSPSYGTALGTNLKWRILTPLVYKVLRSGQLLKQPLLICVITDGCPDRADSPTFENAVLECRQQLVDAGYEPTAVRFCVIQIGRDDCSTSFLERLRTNPNIQDTVYCTTERLDEKYRQFRDNGRYLDDWLLGMLSEPIIHS